MSKLKVGDEVLCRLYNLPESKYYGEIWIGKILKITLPENVYRIEDLTKKDKPYLVTRDDSKIELGRHEIIRRVSNNV